MTNTIGIVCEYNPFHHGHKFHIEEAKRASGAENVVCIMSGSMVQRGEPAIFDKWSRAKTAIDGGADLVIELPAYYALQSAENFAFGAVKILDNLKITDAICFGSEHGNSQLLEKCASVISNPDDIYRNEFDCRIDSGVSYPMASEYALRKCIPDLPDKFFSPNNILGMCYISALMKLGSKMGIYTIKRNNDYHSSHTDDGYMSASAIREMLKSEDDNLSYIQYAPDYSGCDKHYLKNAESYILGFFRSALPQNLKDIKGYEDGLANLVVKAASKSTTADMLFDSCVSKRYTLHRIKRFCMCCMLGIRGELEPSYVRVLGANRKGTALLKKIKKESSLDIVTKASDYHENKMFDMDVAASDFAFLCCDNADKRICGMDFLNSPYIDVTK